MEEGNGSWGYLGGIVAEGELGAWGLGVKGSQSRPQFETRV